MTSTLQDEPRLEKRRAPHGARPVMIGCALSLFWLSGCGDATVDQRAEVFGTVLLDGKLVEKGAISFVPTEGTSGPAAGGEITNGSYHVERAHGPPIGKVRVEFNGLRRTGMKVQGKFGGGQTQDEYGELFPPKFNTDSSVVRELQPGANEVDFDLKSN